MGRYDQCANLDKLLANDVVIGDVVPYSIEQSRDCSTRQIAKNLLREYSAQRFYVEQVYRFGYECN